MYIPLYLYSFFAQIFEFPIREDSNACRTACSDISFRTSVGSDQGLADAIVYIRPKQ
ncbi:Uncharacterized protein XB17_02123 [Leptospira santarosai]|nr:Uncharacterized protein XB17_02123 [Leptospira santarosai]